MAVPVMIVLDAVLVVVFSTFGRGAHSEGLGVTQVWGTAWPFLVGLAVGWLILLAGRREPASIGSGVLLWLATLVVGMVIRGLGDGRVPHWSFMIVAGVVTGLFLVGWRAVRAMLVRRRR
ncbi:putative transmembrane protein [Dietzia cinnamea P4]|nr:putative transmembrane protein [Dietzia cinnamea P4]